MKGNIQSEQNHVDFVRISLRRDAHQPSRARAGILPPTPRTAPFSDDEQAGDSRSEHQQLARLGNDDHIGLEARTRESAGALPAFELAVPQSPRLRLMRAMGSSSSGSKARPLMRSKASM